MAKILEKSLDHNKKLSDFVTWFDEFIKGDEKGEGQIFLERLLQAFGNEGIKEIGAACEVRIKKKSGTTGFVDLLWRPRMILELKKRGEDLSKHYSQAFDYWVSLVPARPKYMVLCNFDEFWIYDLNIQLYDPVHKLKTKDLASDPTSLNFLFPIEKEPIFNNNNVEVTKKTAKIIGEVFNSLILKEQDNLDYENIQRFVLQLVVALFSEDVGLIPKHTLHKILKDTTFNLSKQKEIEKLFLAMGGHSQTHAEAIPYFNGGLFEKIIPINLEYDEVIGLLEASKEDWSCVRPSIFGSIFESTMDLQKRHAGGVHFTSELDIEKIVGPTVIRPFKQKIDRALKSKNGPKELKNILSELENLKILDPACGSGNFLYIAYRELVRLEMEILEKLDKSFNILQIKTSRINHKNFYGIDINSFGVELAKVALSVGRKLSCDEFSLHDNPLPFDNLDKNIICADALFTPWPATDVIIGNPPFLGGGKFRSILGDEYTQKIYEKFSEVKGQADLCTYWFRLAHDSKAKRIGLVGTHSITENQSRNASLDYIIQNGGHIHDAIYKQEWMGEAMVYVSIVNWMRKKPNHYFLDGEEVVSINSSLKNELDLSGTKIIQNNLQLCFEGCKLGGRDFLISEDIAKEWIKKDKRNKEVLKPIIGGNDLVNPMRKLNWVIDFNDMSLDDASLYKIPFAHVKKWVKPVREKNNRKCRRENWWRFSEISSGMRKKFKELKCYFAISKVTKYINFRAIDIDFLPNNALGVITLDDFFVLGVLNSKLHRDWVFVQCGSLGKTPHYTSTTCFETYPFPENATCQQKDKIRKVMRKLEDYRVEESLKRNISITKLYNELSEEPKSGLYKLYQELDRLVVEAYGWEFIPDKNYNEELFLLNQTLTT